MDLFHDLHISMVTPVHWRDELISNKNKLISKAMTILFSSNGIQVLVLVRLYVFNSRNKTQQISTVLAICEGNPPGYRYILLTKSINGDIVSTAINHHQLKRKCHQIHKQQSETDIAKGCGREMYWKCDLRNVICGSLLIAGIRPTEKCLH